MKVLRDGKWNEEDAAVLVPGDIISIKLGDIIPADARLLQGDPLKIDQASLFYVLTIFIFQNLNSFNLKIIFQFNDPNLMSCVMK